MARNFLQYPFAAFQGNFSSKAFNDTQGTQHLSVLAAVGWSNYSIGGAPLGLANPNFSVLVNLNAAGPNTVSQTWQVISVYIDNEAVNFPVYLYFPDTQFSLSCPANSSGWFRVFTLGRQAYVTGLGISNQDIANNAVTNVFFTDAFSVPYLDQENPTAVDMRLASPSFSLPGSNGGVQQIDVIIPGSTLASGALSITGGGGSGAAAHAVLDQFGRVTQVLIDNPGSGYQGPPNVTAVGGFNPPPTWTSGQAWAQGQQATDVGGIFIARQNIQAETFPSTFEPSSTNGATYWEATGINVDVTPQFSASVAPISGGTFTGSGFSATAFSEPRWRRAISTSRIFPCCRSVLPPDKSIGCSRTPMLIS